MGAKPCRRARRCCTSGCKRAPLKFVTQYFLFAHATLATFGTSYDKTAVTIVPPATASGNKKGAARNRNRRVDEQVILTAIGEAALKLSHESTKLTTDLWKFGPSPVW